MKKLLLFLVSFLIGIGLFFWILKFVGFKEIKDLFLAFSGWQMMVILVFTLLMLLVGTLKWKMILKNKGEDISFLNLFKIYLSGFSIMYFFPMVLFGGEIFRGYILSRKKYTSLSKGMASSIVDRILDWTSILIIVLLGIIIFLFTIGFPPKIIGIILAGTLLLFLGIASFFYFKTFKKESIVKFFLKFFRPKYSDKEPLVIEKEIFSFFDPKQLAMWKGFFLAFLGNGMSFLRVYFFVRFLEENIGSLSSFSIFSFSCLASMIPITASLGSHEAIQVFVFKNLGLEAGTGAVLAVIIRAAELIFALFGICIFFHFGLEALKNLLFKNLREDNLSKK